MKKVLLPFLFITFALFSSCSSDDASKSVLKATIDGTEYVFNTFVVNKATYPDYTDVTVTASIDRNASKVISIIFEQGAIGADASWYFAYFLNETAFPKMEGFATEVTESSTSHVKGTFSGQVMADDGSGEIITITNGSFHIFH